MEAEEENKSDEKQHNNETPLPDEEPPVLLGSVTTFSNPEGSDAKVQQIRSSARVSKKMKLDLTVPQVMAEKCDTKKEEVKAEKKCLRPLWTSEDKDIFFEALCEYGKDFEGIQLYISNKLKKKGVADVKTKDQVRHLYYRTWQKITKYLKFADGVKKIVQELYGLINYGELRKKLGSVSGKSLQKLNELVYAGSTVLRIKGKAIRVRTPMCKALRNLNQLDEKYDEVKLPNRIVVELRPKDMLTFLRVQSMAQNPRLKATLPLQKRLVCLIDYLSNKWRTVEAKSYEQALASANPFTNCCLPSDRTQETARSLLNPPLRLTPPRDCRIEIPSINIGEYLTRQNICLSYYENRVGIPGGGSFNYGKGGSKKNARPRTGSMSDKSEKSPHKNTVATVPVIKEEEIEACDKICDIAEAADGLSDDKVCEVKLENPETEETYRSQTAKIEELENEMKQKQARIDAIRKGWTKEDCESRTVGELYLMFGTESRLILEYGWDSPQKVTTTEEGKGEDAQKSADADSEIAFTNSDLGYSLSQLLSIVKLHYRKNVIKCACGHVCGSKSEAQLKRAVQSKIIKIFTNIDKCADDPDEKMQTEDTMFDGGQFVKPKLVPISPSPFYQTGNLASQISSIRGLNPKYCNRRGRKRTKQVVVERKLPLLPNDAESGHQIVRMNIISPEDSLVSVKEESVSSVFPVTTNAVFLQESQGRDIVINEDTLILMNDNTMLSTTPPSPTRILKENEHVWMESEVADYSLSSLLGHLESPVKGEPSTSNMNTEDSRMSQDVDAQLRSMLTESSVDFSAKFADLAEQVTNEIK